MHFVRCVISLAEICMNILNSIAHHLLFLLSHTIFVTTDYFLDSTMAETRKPDKLYATHPKNYGKGSRQCRVTGRMGGQGLIRKYGINMKRQTFRERAIDMGWCKYN